MNIVIEKNEYLHKWVVWLEIDKNNLVDIY